MPLTKAMECYNFGTYPKNTKCHNYLRLRPISCLNTLYKVISKLLADRLTVILSEVVSLNQTAFMTGRMLAENVLLDTDLV